MTFECLTGTLETFFNGQLPALIPACGESCNQNRPRLDVAQRVRCRMDMTRLWLALNSTLNA